MMHQSSETTHFDKVWARCEKHVIAFTKEFIERTPFSLIQSSLCVFQIRNRSSSTRFRILSKRCAFDTLFRSPAYVAPQMFRKSQFVCPSRILAPSLKCLEVSFGAACVRRVVCLSKMSALIMSVFKITASRDLGYTRARHWKRPRNLVPI